MSRLCIVTSSVKSRYDLSICRSALRHLRIDTGMSVQCERARGSPPICTYSIVYFRIANSCVINGVRNTARVTRSCQEREGRFASVLAYRGTSSTGIRNCNNDLIKFLGWISGYSKEYLLLREINNSRTTENRSVICTVFFSRLFLVFTLKSLGHSGLFRVSPLDLPPSSFLPPRSLLYYSLGCTTSRTPPFPRELSFALIINQHSLLLQLH